jgi:hypothetical protein
MLAQFYLFYFYFSGDSTSILLFFRSTESHGKTRSVFTPPKIGALFKNAPNNEIMSLKKPSHRRLLFVGKESALP